LKERKSGLLRQVASEGGSIHINISMTGQEKGEILIHVTALYR
jgi:hypothetical protein